MYAVAHTLNAERDRSQHWLSHRLGSTVGLDHRIVRHLASGGMAHVFLAEHVHDGRDAAAKLTDPASGIPTALLKHEYALLARVRHANVVRALEHGRTCDGHDYLLTDYIPGIDLEDWMARSQARLSQPRLLRLLRQLASAIDHLHALGIVHADIKPANIMLDANADDAATLIDFGLAFELHQAIRRPAGAGTPGYMAPEQLRADVCGPAADRYAFAAVSFELITGAPLEPDDSDWYLGAFGQPPPRAAARPGLPSAALEAVFACALHDLPALRFETASEFVAAVTNALACERPPSAHTRSLKLAGWTTENCQFG